MLSKSVLSRIKGVIDVLSQDINAALTHDPAARNRLEVCLAYPGVHALWAHRIAHQMWTHNYRLSGRVVSHLARLATGIEIHPAARVGKGVFIDHGMGVVIGETATVGDRCVLYQGAVLGGTSKERTVRHPQLGKHVVVGAHACVLGAIEIGDGARIGSGSVVVRPVPAGATVVGVPGRVVAATDDRRARFESTLDHASLPDPVSEMLRSLREQNERLRERVERLEHELNVEHTHDDEDTHLIDARLSTTDLPPQHGG